MICGRNGFFIVSSFMYVHMGPQAICSVDSYRPSKARRHQTPSLARHPVFAQSAGSFRNDPKDILQFQLQFATYLEKLGYR